MKNPTQQLVRALSAALMLGSIVSHARVIVVNNPYSSVNWTACGRQRANLHTHTTESDGSLFPNEVIDSYKERQYTVLALTDHNKYTWPWTNWDRDPYFLDMVAIRGCEASRHHHINSFFCDYDGASGDVDETCTKIGERGGIAQINHPGRYDRSIAWYRNLYATYPHVKFMEVYNQGDRYSGDREKWDSLLSRTMPETPVWGTSNDDMHRSDHLGRNWQVILTESKEIAGEEVRTSLESGCFYLCFDMSGTSENAVELDSLIVDAESIGAYANWPDDSIRWISEGREVARGASLSLSSTPDLGCYVRAVIHGADGARTLTQPIGLAEQDVELRPSVHHTPSLRIRVSARETADGNRRIVCNSSTPVGVRVFDASGRLVLVSHVSRTRPVVLDHRHARGVLIAQVRPGRDAREAASTEILTIE